MVIISSKFDSIFAALSGNALVSTLEIIDANGVIDSDMLLDALGTAADKYGNLVIDVPIVGRLTFSSGDISKLRGYMGGSYG